MLLQPAADDLFRTANNCRTPVSTLLRNYRADRLDLGARSHNIAHTRAYLVHLANGYTLDPEMGTRNYLFHYGRVLFKPAAGIVLF
jgi:hypothetical protein